MEPVFRALFIVLIVTILKAEATFTISDAFKADIEITINQNGIDESLALVSGAGKCGGSGTFVELRYPCASTTDTCQVHGDNVARVAQLRFTAGNTITQLGARIKIGSPGYSEHTLADKAIASSAVTSGQTYQVYVKLSASPKTIDHKVTVKIELYDAGNAASLQLCAQADFKVIK